MKTSTFTVALAAASTAYSQAFESFYNETSAPFNLIVTSEDGAINSTTTACHTGAAIESLCLSNSFTPPLESAVFNFNTSVWSSEPEPGFGKPGILTWWLATSSGSYPSSASFYIDATTNLALPLLFPGSNVPQILAFDSNNKLTIQGDVDNSANPPTGTTTTKNYYRWFACKTWYSGYTYENIAWGLGPNKPENPTCVAVSVTRKFV